MLRYLLASLLLAACVSARFRGNNAFVVDDFEDYDQDGEIVTPASTTTLTFSQPKAITIPYMIERATTETSTSAESSTTTTTLAGDGHDPMEVVEAAIDMLNTPVHKIVGSNPLRRLLRLVGPTKTDFLYGIKLTREVQKAAGHPTIESPVTDLPPVVDHLFGYQESDNELFHKTTTLPPLFPIMPYDHDTVYKVLNKILAESAAKTTIAPLPKL